jgi:hypothetical protein
MSKSIVELEQDFYNHFLKMDKNSYGLIKIWKYLEEHVFSQFKESQPTVDGGYPNPNTAETGIQRLNEQLTEFAQIIDKKDREIESIKVCSEARKREILRIREESNEAIEQLQEQLKNQQQPTEVERMKEGQAKSVEHINLKDAFDFAEFMWANIKGDNCTNGYYTNQMGEQLTVSDFWQRFKPFKATGHTQTDEDVRDYEASYKPVIEHPCDAPFKDNNSNHQ